jgi:hypothetical protein
VKLMVQSEDQVVSYFNRLFTARFPNVQTSATSPFKTTVQVTDASYYTELINCFEQMMRRLSSLDSSG